ncbi:MAG: efflux RND transporter periplasmic adaptor subunit [Dehalobacter sp. 4CP]|uniref:efflux RND transporter periplasmic adaptor subunit n=1 Tax=unclassified Dehalobacter TaxID=2635733 RepID=UPI0013C7D7A3|nr:efflux RND transporter periplasmic adaptor subunit [Dehalobacter sp.]MDJ0305080.1 efflux RND transporter periplasmic adaptor subunit [Dehalobacter sp.]NBJ16734.1 efflux RND transporter periplasmic adaptor subunit [Dehalobacter sp. 4CP]
MKFKMKRSEQGGSPDLKKPIGKKKMIITVIAILLVLLVGVRIYGAIQSAAEKKAAEQNRQNYVPVEALTLHKQSISSAITLSGKVEADKEASVVVGTPAKVAAVYTKVGDRVSKGQVLFSLDKTDLMSSYNQASAAYQLAQAGYETNMANYENSKKNYENMKQLYEIGAVSKSELDQAAVAASDAVLETYKGQLAQAKAAYDAAQKALNDMDVKAPIDGVLTALDVKIGSMVMSAVSPARVVDLNKVFVTVSLSEQEINSVHSGQSVQIEVPAASVKVKGVIDSVSIAANAQGKYALRTYIDNKDGIIKPGMFANVTLNIAGKDNVLAVPTDAVIFHGGKDVVYVAKDNAAAEMEVTTGLESGTETEIVGGLTEGDIVIIKGQNFVQDGTEIKVVTVDGKQVAQETTDTAASAQTGGGVQK